MQSFVDGQLNRYHVISSLESNEAVTNLILWGQKYREKNTERSRLEYTKLLLKDKRPSLLE